MSTRRLLLVLGGAVSVLCVVFGVTIVRQQNAFRAYYDATVRDATPRWQIEDTTPEACISLVVDWALACPGLGTWCDAEAPRQVHACMASRDRSAYCRELGDRGGSTDFGVAQCTAMREGVEGRAVLKSHKKFCAAGYRAIADYCKSHAQ